MQILALETSTDFGTCALWQDGQILTASCPPGRSHSETLIPLVQQLLAEAGSSFAALDALAFGMGPGAFTGLRVACGIAQGMAVALDRPVLPVGSLETMAWEAGGQQVLALLDARMGEVYAATFRCGSADVEVLGALCLASPAELHLPPADQPWLAVGNALAAYPELLARCAGWECLPGILPHARSVAHLAAQALARGEGLDPALAAPRYLRDKVARTVAERLANGGKV
ncbi:MAG: tRNA (adenosine(37)-N6)-threonylcarbamoyltransferase complex dimerization subunit type 1 TsaB [Azovibrio sp.]|uniref:tRNA (adenosine(37)-N6)-threonylcarbamoyltransferase complex dimerization subunit type 1 TsaB n=1 Tax=Azovibrio sp. TaxID=1872673 RepID=UPI003C764D29